MKTLLLIRHAKSSWDNPLESDFDRPLNERGKTDAPAMAKKIRKHKIDLDAIVSSPARRALETATFFSKEFKLDTKKIHLAPALYEASGPDFSKTVASLDDSQKVIALFAHNPGITDFINSLKCTFVSDMPTCGVYAIKIKTKTWRDFGAADKKFLFLEYPKNS